MKNLIVGMLIMAIHFGMTKQEFEKQNGFPGICSETIMPLIKLESCKRGDSTYFYINHYLTSWETHDHIY